MNQLLDIFITCSKVGAMTFGGGYAMLPILQREVVEKKGWATDEEIADYFAIAQCAPGAIAVNTVIFIGQKMNGAIGGFAAAMGVMFPSLLIISLLAGMIETFSHLAWVQHAFGGIRICVCVLIANAVMKLYRKAIIDKATMLLFLLISVGAYVSDINPVIFVVLAAVTGIVLTEKNNHSAKQKYNRMKEGD